jgi:hypothetical protein
MRPPNSRRYRGSLCENDYWPSIPLKGYYSKHKYICKVAIIFVEHTKNILYFQQRRKANALAEITIKIPNSSNLAKIMRIPFEIGWYFFNSE